MRRKKTPAGRANTLLFFFKVLLKLLTVFGRIRYEYVAKGCDWLKERRER